MAISQTIVWTAGAAVISAASMAGGYITSQVIGPEHRITMLEARADTNEKQDDAWRADIKDYRKELDARLERIENKIDQIVERSAVRRK